MSDDTIQQPSEVQPAADQQTQEYLDGWKRALADYDNLKKDIARQTRDMRDYQIVSFFEELLPIVDLYETALQHVPDGEKSAPWFEGFRQIHIQLQQFIKDNNMVKIDVDGSFDPARHEAVDTRADEARPDGDVLSVVSSGYIYNNKVVRPAKVVVNKLTK